MPPATAQRSAATRRIAPGWQAPSAREARGEPEKLEPFKLRRTLLTAGTEERGECV